jgi:2-hydroxy-3-oxopropionate reductase
MNDAASMSHTASMSDTGSVPRGTTGATSTIGFIGLDVLAGGLAGSRILDLKRESMLARRFTPGFRIDLHHKDMGIALAAARQAEVLLPMTGLTAQLIAAARAQGYGALDHSALLNVVEDLSGRTFARTDPTERTQA